MKTFAKKLMSVIICVMVIMASIPAAIPANAGTYENVLSGAISYGIKKIPYIGSLADTISMPYINKALGIKPDMSIEDLSKQIDMLSVKIDSNQQELLSKMYEDSATSFNDLITGVQTSTSQAYSQIAKIINYYEKGKTGELSEREEMLEQLELANIATSKFYSTAGLLEKITKAEAYISGRNYKATDSALMIIYKSYCKDAVFGGEAGLLAKNSVEAIAKCMENAYFAADVILQANLYVYNHLDSYKEYKANGDEDFDIFEKNEFRDKNATEGVLEQLINGYSTLFGNENIEKELDTDTVISGGVFGDYNKMLEEVHFYYIDNCDYASSPAKITYIPLMRELSFAMASQGGYENKTFKSNKNSINEYDSISKNINNTIKSVTDGNISKDRLVKIYNHINNNKLFGTYNNNASLQATLENYGFSFDSYNNYVKENNVSSNTKKILGISTDIFRFVGGGSEIKVSLFGAEMDDLIGNAAKNVEKKLVLSDYTCTRYNDNSYSEHLTTCGYDDVAVFSFRQCYKINNEDSFISFIKSIANGDNKANKTFVLTKDLDLKNFEYSVIWPDASYKKEFKGTFDGDGHTIKNFFFTNSKEHRVALFRTTGEGAVIKNLVLANVRISGAADKNGYAALVGYANGNLTLDNVTLRRGEIEGYNYVGGLVGEASRSAKMTITNCSNRASVTSGNADAAGIIANSGEYYLYNCSNFGEITAKAGAAGGISAYIGDKNKSPDCYVEKCANHGTITGYDCTGGICGHIQTDHTGVKIIDNSNNGIITNTAKRTAGGIVGRFCAVGTFSGNKNSGEVINKATGADSAVGGILGYNEDDEIVLNNNANSGDITGIMQAGGIAGLLDSKSADKKVTASSNTNSGNVISTSKNAGGIIGSLRTDNTGHSITENSNTGAVSGNESSGGIIGFMAGGGLFDSNTNKADVISAISDAGGIVGNIEDDKCNFRHSDVDGIAVVGAVENKDSTTHYIIASNTKKNAGKICGWDGKTKSVINSDNLLATAFGDGNAIIIISMAAVLVAAGVVFIIVYKKRKQNDNLVTE